MLWLGWTVLFGGVFSYTQGIYHSYYTAALAPGIAALAGISAVAVLDLAKQLGRGCSCWRQWPWSPSRFSSPSPATSTASSTGHTLLWWWPSSPASASQPCPSSRSAFRPLRARYRRRRPAADPGSLVILRNRARIPEHHPASGGATSRRVGPHLWLRCFDNGVATLANWLQANTAESTKWKLVVTSAQNASTLIAPMTCPCSPSVASRAVTRRSGHRFRGLSVERRGPLRPDQHRWRWSRTGQPARQPQRRASDRQPPTSEQRQVRPPDVATSNLGPSVVPPASWLPYRHHAQPSPTAPCPLSIAAPSTTAPAKAQPSPRASLLSRRSPASSRYSPI